MRRSLAASILLTATLFFCAISAEAQRPVHYLAPHKLPITTQVKRAFPKYFSSPRTFERLIPEGFYPIGWSRDGKFAFYTEPVDEACGCYFAYLVIQDMRSDKTLWEYKYDQTENRPDKDGNVAGPANIRELWKREGKLFSQKLAEHGIVAGNSALLAKNFRISQNNFSASAKSTRGPNSDGYEDRVNFYTVSLSSPRLGSKDVHRSEDHTKDEYWFMLDADVIGAIKSPFEDRVAIIAIEVMRGYEGPPHTGRINIVGADLKSGFKK